jgi:hypothetical protein
VHQVGLEDSGSQNFRTLVFKEEAVEVTQIYPTTAATVCDRRNFFIDFLSVFIGRLKAAQNSKIKKTKLIDTKWTQDSVRGRFKLNFCVNVMKKWVLF